MRRQPRERVADNDDDDGQAAKRPAAAATAALTQLAVVPGCRAGEYQQPDHAAGEAAWPGKQPATKQLSLFAFVVKQQPTRE